MNFLDSTTAESVKVNSFVFPSWYFYLHVLAEFICVHYLFFWFLSNCWLNKCPPQLSAPPSNKGPPFSPKFWINASAFIRGNMVFYLKRNTECNSLQNKPLYLDLAVPSILIANSMVKRNKCTPWNWAILSGCDLFCW